MRDFFVLNLLVVTNKRRQEYNNIKNLFFGILFLISCRQENALPLKPVDAELFNLVKQLNGNWISVYTQIWNNNSCYASNNSCYASYNSIEIDCNAKYNYQYDIVKEFNIDSLKVSNTYFCTPSKLTTFELKRDAFKNIYIEERSTKKVVTMKYDKISVSTDSLKLSGTPIGNGNFQPYNPYKYVILLKRK